MSVLLVPLLLPPTSCHIFWKKKRNVLFGDPAKLLIILECHVSCVQFIHMPYPFAFLRIDGATDELRKRVLKLAFSFVTPHKIYFGWANIYGFLASQTEVVF